MRGESKCWGVDFCGEVVFILGKGGDLFYWMDGFFCNIFCYEFNIFEINNDVVKIY